MKIILSLIKQRFRLFRGAYYRKYRNNVFKVFNRILKNNQLWQIKWSGMQASRFILLILGSFISVVSFSREIYVNGTVTSLDDTTGLPGVTVVIEGTDEGTITDFSGKYKINVSDDATLLFSFIGMESQEIQVGNQTKINVVLEKSQQDIDEIVVVGYATQKKVNLSGAVDAVDAEVMSNRPIANISQGLQGVIPNLNIDFTSGEPGEAANINIRGFTSINGGDPLILIDGVSSTSEELNWLDPGDVSNISVLKDASSAAIYGARAAFGVILITTKTGHKEGIHISYNNNLSWETPTLFPDKITDPYIHMRLLETSTDNTPWDNVNYTDDEYAWAAERSDNPNGTNGVKVDPEDESLWAYMGNRDWTKYFLSDYTFSQQHHVAIDGSSEKAQYYLSGSYNHQDGSLKIADDYYERYNLREKINYHPYKFLTIGNNTLFSSNKRVEPTYLTDDDAMQDLYNLTPTDWDVNPDGTWANTTTGEYAAKLTDGGDYKRQYNSFQTTFTTEVRMFEDALKLNADYTFRRGTQNLNYNYKTYNIGYGPDDVREIGSSSAYRGAAFDYYNGLNIYGSFNKTLKKHYFNLLAGFNQEYTRSESFDAEKSTLISSSLPTIALATGEDVVDEAVEDWAIRGYFGRLNYIFNERYILEFNGRYDGSSKFPEGKRWGFFPSASAAWRVDKESFMNEVSFISQLKFRGSYGKLGNQATDAYGYSANMSASDAGYIIDGEVPQQISSPDLVSANYTWEEVTTIDFGVDLGVFNDKLVTNFDIYQRDNNGMLIPGSELAAVIGAEAPEENAGDMRTKGWEWTLSYRNSFKLAGKPLYYNAKFTLADNQATILHYDNETKNLTEYYEGMKIGEIWGLQNDGLFQSEEEIAALDESEIIPWDALDIVNGWPKYKDLDESGSIQKGTTVDDPKDLSVIGNMSPRYRYSLDLNFQWNGFDFRAFLQGVGKRDYYPLDYLYWGYYQQPYGCGYNHLTDFYRESDDSEELMNMHSQTYIDAGLANANTDAEYPVLQSWLADRNLGERVDESMGLAIPQSKYLLNGAYLRLKNITIGYTLPSKLTRKIHIDKLRIFVSGDNIAEWSELKKYYDPEAINDAIEEKYDPSAETSRGNGTGYVYPYKRKYSFGINVNF